jgi:hypothetical protein
MQQPATTELTIQWRPNLIDRLCELVFRQPNLEERPRECGGLLLGTVLRNGDRVEIILRQYKPISCSYQDGPLFHLSAADKASLLQQPTAPYESPYYSCIGFYRSHRRPGLELDEHDLQLAREHLKDPPGIFVLVAENGPHTVFAFDGHEFSAGHAFVESSRPPPARGVFTPELQPPPASDPGDFIDKGLNALTRLLHEAAEPVRKTASAHLSRLTQNRVAGWLACTMIVLVIGLFAVWSRGEWHVPSNSEIKNSARFKTGLSLVTSVERDHVRIAWNPRAPSVAGASNGMLLVTDGLAHHAIPLDNNVIALGSVVYYPTSDVAKFELRIGDLTGSFVAAGLGSAVKTIPPLAARASEQEPVLPRPKDALKDTGATGGTTSSLAFTKTPRPVDPRRLSLLASDSGSERTRSKYQAPPAFRPPPATLEVLQPPDPGVTANPAL